MKILLLNDKHDFLYKILWESSENFLRIFWTHRFRLFLWPRSRRRFYHVIRRLGNRDFIVQECRSRVVVWRCTTRDGRIFRIIFENFAGKRFLSHWGFDTWRPWGHGRLILLCRLEGGASECFEDGFIGEGDLLCFWWRHRVSLWNFSEISIGYILII